MSHAAGNWRCRKSIALMLAWSLLALTTASWMRADETVFVEAEGFKPAGAWRRLPYGDLHRHLLPTPS